MGIVRGTARIDDIGVDSEDTTPGSRLHTVATQLARCGETTPASNFCGCGAMDLSPWRHPTIFLGGPTEARACVRACVRA